jgi:hypothetical protein
MIKEKHENFDDITDEERRMVATITMRGHSYFRSNSVWYW